MTIPTKEQLIKVINELKARKYDIDQETKIVISRIAFYSGQLEILREHEENSAKLPLHDSI